MRAFDIAPPPTGALALESEVAPSTKDLFGRTRLNLRDGRINTSCCVQCEDRPCQKWRPDELDRSLPVAQAGVASADVCPSGAISFEDHGVPSISEDCLGCGICAQRCPVGALYVAEAKAGVSTESEHNVYGAVRSGSVDFYSARKKIAVELDHQTYEREAVHQHLVDCMREADASPGTGWVPLLTRNILLAAGAPASLARSGDNHAVCEVVSFLSPNVVLAEVASESDSLTSCRRLSAGAAVAINRHSISKENLVLALTVKRLPSRRVDTYEMLQNMQDRLGVVTILLPVPLLLLAPLNPTLDLVAESKALRQSMSVLDTVERVARQFGLAGSLGEIGLAPS